MDHTKLSAKVGEWTKLADHARKELSRSRHGSMQAVLNRISEQHGIHEQIIRRVVAAHRFLEKLSLQHPHIAKKMASSPFAAVEQIDRWFARDPVSAIAAANSYLTGDETVRSLTDKESETRPQEFLLDMSQPKLNKWFIEKISTGLGACYKIIKPPELLKMGTAKLFFEHIEKNSRQNRVAVIRIGPYEFHKSYERHLCSVMLEAVGLRASSFNVIVAVVGCEKIELYNNFLAEMRLSTNRIIIVNMLEMNANLTGLKFKENQPFTQFNQQDLGFHR